MSEPIPESIPTSADPRSHRATKKRALTPRAAISKELETLMSKPDRPIHIPTSSSASSKTLPPPPEIVANVQGSSAGAGSGEFHVYKASRRREYERLRLMEEEKASEEARREFERKREEMERRDRERTEKNRAKRMKKREKKMEAKKRKGSEDVEEGKKEEGGPVKKLVPMGVAKKGEDGKDEVGGEKKGEDVETPVAEEVGIVIHDDD